MRRGELYHLKSWPLSRGHEQQGRRFAVILQSDEIPMLSTVVVVPTSTKVFDTPWHVRLDMGETTTYALCEQTCAVDLSRLGDFAGMVDFDELLAIERAIRLVFDI